MNLFDDIKRTYSGPSEYAEPKFIYLNRSSRPPIEKIRAVLEEWFSNYPELEKKELRSRFRDSNDNQHSSAFFELFLHELLLQLKCLIKIHPKPDNGKRKLPDFLVTPPDGKQFYLEAVLATDESDQEKAARARKNTIYDSLNRLNSPNFFIGMDLNGNPDTQPPAKTIKTFLTERLSGLDVDKLYELQNKNIFNKDNIPQWHYEHDGWDITFFPIAKSPETRGKPGIRPIGTQSTEIQYIEVSSSIKKAITKKATRYGQLDLPYIIAVNVLSSWGSDNSDILDALYGQEAVKIGYIGNEYISQQIRKPNGAWRFETGPINTRVSAALVLSELYPSSISKADIRLYHNPWTTKPYSSALTRFPQTKIIDNKIVQEKGELLEKIIGLPSDWPMDSKF